LEYPDLEKIQFIAHSAGTWCAFSAIRYLAKFNEARSEGISDYQLTLLDPYIPGDANSDRILHKEILDDLKRHLEIRLESYYSDDPVVSGTNDFLSTGWLGVEVESWLRPTERRYPNISEYIIGEGFNLGSWIFTGQSRGFVENYTYDDWWRYHGHSGPIRFYSDSIHMGRALESALRNTPGSEPLERFYQLIESERRFGFSNSLIYEEVAGLDGDEETFISDFSPARTTLSIMSISARNSTPSNLQAIFHRNAHGIGTLAVVGDGYSLFRLNVHVDKNGQFEVEDDDGTIITGQISGGSLTLEFGESSLSLASVVTPEEFTPVQIGEFAEIGKLFVIKAPNQNAIVIGVNGDTAGGGAGTISVSNQLEIDAGDFFVSLTVGDSDEDLTGEIQLPGEERNSIKEPIRLAEAVNAQNLTWVSESSSPWFPQTVTSYDGDASVQSGPLSDNEDSLLKTTVTGPGTISFWWKVSSEDSFDSLRFFLGNTELKRISGSVDWNQSSFSIPSGEHTLAWQYTKNDSLSSGSDCGWVDLVTYTQTEVLSINPLSRNHSFDAVADQSINVTGNVSWQASKPASDSWVTITDGSSGNGDGVLIYSVETNPVATSRSTTITITGGQITREFVIEQAGAPVTLSLDDDSQQFSSAEGSHSIEVFSNSNWNWTTSSSWISSSESPNQHGDESFSYSVSANDSPAERSGTITFIAGNVSRTHTITQDSAPPDPALNVSPSELDFTYGAGNESLSVSSNVSWTASDDSSWISVSPTSGSNNGSVTVTVQANSSTSPRNGTVTISGGGIRDTVIINQMGVASTRVIALSGDLNFGDVTVGQRASRTLEIQNTGNSPLRVNNISYPSGFSGAWSGTIAAGSSQNVSVTFSPTAEQNYGGNLTVDSDATGGTNTRTVSGKGIVVIEDGLWRSASSHGDWLVLPWFGFFAELQEGWIYHAEHGYQYCLGEDTSSYFFYDLIMESWFWTSATLYPYLYKFEENAGWYCYYIGGTLGQRWFNRLADASDLQEGAINKVVEDPDFEGMVFVEGGTLSTSNELDGTKVDSFYIGRTEVTWGEWKKVRSWAVEKGYDLGGIGEGCGDEYPVQMVSILDVAKWCNAKSEMEGLIVAYRVISGTYRTGEPIHTSISLNSASNGYRLPIEAEWEFAARGGNATNDFMYAGSNDLNSVGWYRDNSYGSKCASDSSGRGTWPVGGKLANELGLFDMSGNVREWCWDVWSIKFSHTSGDSGRTFRGGSWFGIDDNCKVWKQGTDSADARRNFLGFRLIRSATTGIDFLNDWVENFDNDLGGFWSYSVSSNKNWEYSTKSLTESGYARISGYGAEEASDDWLISQMINLPNGSNPVLSFKTVRKFTGPDLEVLISTNFNGVNPDLADWSSLDANLSQGDYIFVESGPVSLAPYIGSSVHIAFRYTSNGPDSGDTATYLLDEVRIEDVASQSFE
jgi:sulfatase modifying factor 1